jgi:tRNA-guanine family transglycosylase
MRGLDVMKQFGGLRVLKAGKAILTDSGGFQVWSLGECANFEEGVSLLQSGDNCF